MSDVRVWILDPPKGDPTLRRVRWIDELGVERQKSYRGTGSLKRAKAKATEVTAKLERGLNTNAANMTLLDFGREWWTDYAKSPSISEATRKRMFAPAMKNWIFPRLGNVKLGAVKRKTLDGFVTWMGRQGASPSTIRVVMTTLTNMLERAVEWDYIASNPARGVKRPVEEAPEREAYEPAVVLHLAACMPTPRDRYLVAFTAFAGLRQGEVFGLRWATVHDDHFKVWRTKKKGSTGKWSTEIPLFPPAKAALDAWRPQTNARKDKHVFPSAKGTSLAHQTSSWLRRHWWHGCVMAGMAKCAGCEEALPTDVDVASRVGLDPREQERKLAAWERRGAKGWKRPADPPPVPWRCECGHQPTQAQPLLQCPEFHELRHTFGTLAFYATKDLKQVAEWMGHSDTKMLEKLYKKQTPTGRRLAIEQMATMLSEWEQLPPALEVSEGA